jgi:hypothetical protein
VRDPQRENLVGCCLALATHDVEASVKLHVDLTALVCVHLDFVVAFLVAHFGAGNDAGHTARSQR